MKTWILSTFNGLEIKFEMKIISIENGKRNEVNYKYGIQCGRERFRAIIR